MSQYPPPNPASNYPPPFSPETPPQRRSIWVWILGIGGVLVLMPCLCCSGLLGFSFLFKEVTISDGEHMGGSPMNVKFNYAFADQGHGPPKAYFIVVQTAGGTKREQPIGGMGFGPQRIALRGTWQFHAGPEVAGQDDRRPVKVWIESEEHRGHRSTASNTLTIAPKS